MVCRILSVLALAVLAAGCGNDPVQERPATRAVAASASRAAPSSSASASTVCAAYRRQLNVVRIRLRLVAAPNAEALRRREASLQAMIADACE